MTSASEFKAMRQTFVPERVSLVFVLESPPLNHGFVYDARGRTSEVLFRAFMRLIGASPINKYDGLMMLRERGWVLTNATYIPVNKMPDRAADELIRNDYESFKKDLLTILGGDKTKPLLLVKKNIFTELAPRLREDGFVVANTNFIPFPLHYHANQFQTQVSQILKELGIR